MADLVLREDREGVATLTLNRPDTLNALNGAMFEALDRHLRVVAKEKKQVGVVVLRGAGGNFSSGYDMAEIALMLSAHAKPHFQSEVIERLADLPQPVISAVEGQCSTGALELALAADLIVATETAVFSDVYARWGLTPIWGMSLRLPMRIGTAKAREMIYTCRSYRGREAERNHLVNLCFREEEFEVELDRLARDILANSWYSNRVNKHVLTATDGLTLRDARALEMFKNEGVSPDSQQRVAAFLERHGKQGRP